MFCTVCTSAQKTLIQLSSTMWMQSKECINFPWWCFVSVIKGHCFELQPRGVLSYNSTFLVSFFFRSSLPRYCGHCKKGSKSAEACSVQTKPYPLSKHWTYCNCKVVNPSVWYLQYKYTLLKKLTEYTGYRGSLPCRVPQGGRELWDLLISR